MADRTVATTDTFNDFRREVNGTARDIGDIADLLSASGFIASSTDLSGRGVVNPMYPVCSPSLMMGVILMCAAN